LGLRESRKIGFLKVLYTLMVYGMSIALVEGVKYTIRKNLMYKWLSKEEINNFF